MNLHLENVDLSSLSGPNSFARKLIKYLSLDGHNVVELPDAEARLCFIETFRPKCEVPLFQRLDGIYFNTLQDFKRQNANIYRTYKQADGVIFQSRFNKELTFKFFGEHPNSIVIPNGADVELIKRMPLLEHSKLDRFENIWSCAASWRPHKRLGENIRYFFEHSHENDCLVVAGKVSDKFEKSDRIFYVGEIDYEHLLSLYKASKYFLHLAWLDHCPNVVVDARASGCQIVCSSTGGTKEIAGPNAIVIEEEEWNFEPLELYSPPEINFDRKVNNKHDLSYNMHEVSQKYHNFIDLIIHGEK